MNTRELVVVAAITSVIVRLMRDAGQGGVGAVRQNARSYFAIGVAAGVAGLAVEVFPPAGVTAAGLLVVSVALTSTTQPGTGHTWFDDLIFRLIGPQAPAAGAVVGGASGTAGRPGNPNQPPDSQPGGINRPRIPFVPF